MDYTLGLYIVLYHVYCIVNYAKWSDYCQLQAAGEVRQVLSDFKTANLFKNRPKPAH